jgi:hypothetical protein
MGWSCEARRRRDEKKITPCPPADLCVALCCGAMANYSHGNYAPSFPPERAFFEALWTTANPKGDEVLAGHLAVAFFQKSEIEIPLLRQVWTTITFLFDHDHKPSLSLSDMDTQHRCECDEEREFFHGSALHCDGPKWRHQFVERSSRILSLRLFNHHPPPSEHLEQTAGNQLPPPRFIGVPVPTVSPSPPPVSASPPPAQAYAISPDEQQKYSSLFSTYDSARTG